MFLQASVSNSTGTHSNMVLAENFGCTEKNPSQRRRHDKKTSYLGILRARTESQFSMRVASFATISVLYWHLRTNRIRMSIGWKTDVDVGGQEDYDDLRVLVHDDVAWAAVPQESHLVRSRLLAKGNEDLVKPPLTD